MKNLIHTRGYHALMYAIAKLEENGICCDDEGEDTQALKTLAADIAEAALNAPADRAPNAPPVDNFYPNGIAHLIPPLTLNAYQLRCALELANPDGPGDADQLQTEVSIQFKLAGKDTDGEDAPAGLYVWLTEYPEEGSLFLDPLTPLARSAA